MNPSKLLGTARIKVDGVLLSSKSGAKLMIGGVNRKTIMGDTGTQGFAEEPVPASIECEINFGVKTDAHALAAIEDATVTFECDTGQVYVLRNAWLENPPEVTAGEGGSVPLKFVGMSLDPLS